jgi:hypothetical protein
LINHCRFGYVYFNHLPANKKEIGMVSEDLSLLVFRGSKVYPERSRMGGNLILEKMLLTPFLHAGKKEIVMVSLDFEI